MRRSRAVLLGAIVSWLSLGFQGNALARQVWTQIAYLQILEGPDEVRVFLEVERVTDYRDEVFARLMSAHPTEETVSQSVLTIDARGKATETVIPRKPPGPTFHPNLSNIFRMPDGFYLYDQPAMNHPASLLKWRGDHFAPLSERESEEARKLISDQTFPGVLNELDAISARSGWRRQSDRAFMFSDSAHPFVSSKHQIRVSVKVGDMQERPIDASFRPSAVVAESILKGEPWTKTLIKVDTSRRRVRPKSIWRR
jgi:hypothetical protein